jgi:hypothetical protein
MVPEDLLFWIAPLDDAPVDDHNVLCERHADAMVVPRSWTLDDRREPVPRLFMPRRPVPTDTAPARPTRRRHKPAPAEAGEQLQIDGTGEIPRPALPAEPGATDAVDDGPTDDPADDRSSRWQPAFDVDDDLDGLLEVRSPLLARAFRGTGRPRA